MTVSLKPVSQALVAGARRQLNGWTTSSPSAPALPVDDLELDLVDVDRVGVRGEVVDLPDLGRADGRVLGDRVHPLACATGAVPARACRAAPLADRRRRDVSESTSFSETCACLARRAERRDAAEHEPAGWRARVARRRSRRPGTASPGRWCPGRPGRSRLRARRRRRARPGPGCCRTISVPDRHVREVDDHVRPLGQAPSAAGAAAPAPGRKPPSAPICQKGSASVPCRRDR